MKKLLFVIIIFSIVMLSLGIYLIRNFFITTIDIQSEIDEQTKAQISILLEQGEIIAIPLNKKVIDIGKEDVFGLGIQNMGNPGTFKVQVSLSGAYDKQNTDISSEVVESEWLLYDDASFDLDPDDNKQIPIPNIQFPKQKTNHESTKGLKHENRKDKFDEFVKSRKINYSSFRLSRNPVISIRSGCRIKSGMTKYEFLRNRQV